MAKMATLTIPQVETLAGIAAQLKTSFGGLPSDDVMSVVRLFLQTGQDDRPVAQSPGGTKSEQLIGMLTRPKGTTLDEVVQTFGIKKNSAYARISVEARRRGLKVDHTSGGRYHAHQ